MVYLGRSQCTFTSEASMVKIIVEKLFEEELDNCLGFAYNEFGQKTAVHWQESYEKIINGLIKYPESYPPVRELRGVGVLFRGAKLMKNFKIIYHYDEAENTVYLHDLWNMRRSSINLKGRFYEFENV